MSDSAIQARHTRSDAPGFGPLLRRHRTTAGLSQEALAERAGLSTRAVSDLERGVKTRPHPATMRLLADALDLDSDQRAELAAASRPGVVSAVPPPAPNLVKLPVPHAPIVGRARELATALDLLHAPDVRLLTLTGPGGVGKTRLALEVARTIASDYPGGVAFVELAPLTGPDLVPTAVAGILGLREEPARSPADALREYLHSRRLLLVLDNCEHLLDGVRPFVTDLLATGLDLTVLATSRGPLRLRGEHLLPVPPLTLPDREQAPDAVAMAAIPAIDLFVQRARAVSPAFELTGVNARDVAEICTRLDGLPLAIELAAVRIRSLSPAALTSLLGDRLRLLTSGPHDAPARQRTLRAAIGWSYDLLSSEHQALMRRLAVFAGGFTLESATAITDNDLFATLDGLEVLVDAGLLPQSEGIDADRRYGMLETVREFALGELAASGEGEAIQVAHARHLLALANEAGDHLHGPMPGIWLDRIAAEGDNLRAALGWSLGDTGSAGEPELALRLAAALWPWWHMRGHLQEGHAWLERAVAQGDRVDPATRASAYLTLANVANNLEDHGQAGSLYRKCLDIFEHLGNQAGAAGALTGLGMVATSHGEYDRAEICLTQALAIWREAGNEAGSMTCFYALGRLEMARGELEAANGRFLQAGALCPPEDVGTLAYLDLEIAHLQRLRGNVEVAMDLATQCLASFQEIGERRAEATARAELAHLALLQGDQPQAANRFCQAIRIHQELRDEFGVVICLEGLAHLAASRAQPEEAVSLIATADAWRLRTGTVCTASDRAAIDHLTSRNHTLLGPAAFDRAWNTGKGAGLDAAVDQVVRSISQ